MTVDFDFVRACEFDLYQISELKRGKIPSIAIRVSDEGPYFRHEPLRDGSEILGEGTDTLGKYLYEHPNIIITLFDTSIYMYAAFSKLEAVQVANVVLIHEIAHSVTHLGLLGKRKIHWENFGQASQNKEEKERFAQLATWLYIDEISSTPLRRTFEKMSDDSPEEYKTWKKVVDGARRKSKQVNKEYKSSLHETILDSNVDKSVIGKPFAE